MRAGGGIAKLVGDQGVRELVNSEGDDNTEDE